MTIIIAGAGLAGLSCALALADAGHDVELHEAAPVAGGRCRSWFDEKLGAVIDNGSHLLAGSNSNAWDYLRRIGSQDSLEPLPAALSMMDLMSGRRWRTEALPLLPTILAALPRLALAEGKTVAQALGHSRHYRDFWHPLALAALNTPPEQAQARLLRAVLVRTLWRGAKASRLYQPKTSLGASFIDPAMTALRQAGVAIHLSHPLRRIIRQAGRVDELIFDDQTRRLSRHDRLVLALPPWAARRLLPTLPKLQTSPIANLHFKLDVAKAERLDDLPLGLVGGLAQWLFLRGNILSVTLSALDLETEQSIGEVWRDVAKALETNGEIPPYRLIRERRATILHDGATETQRPAPDAYGPIILAGDWTATGLPCSIEGSILSGRRAAALGSKS